MKCQILFSGENKKNIANLSSAELAKTVANVKSFFYVVVYFCQVREMIYVVKYIVVK